MMLNDFKNIQDNIIFLEGLSSINFDSKDESIKLLNDLFTKYYNYLRDLLDSYFEKKNIDVISSDMIENIILVNLLKENNIELSSKQLEDNRKYIEIIKKILEILKEHIIVFDQIKNFETYIDITSFDKLKLSETSINLCEVILYNKKVFDKKNGICIDDEVEKAVEEVEIVEPLEDIKVVASSTKSSKKKKRKQKPKNVVLMFETVDDLKIFVENEFLIDLPDDLYGKDLCEMNSIVNLLRTKEFKGINEDTELLENIFKYSSNDIIIDIKDVLESTCFTIKDLLEIKSVFFSNRCEGICGNYEDMIEFIRAINFCPYLETKNEKMELLKMNNRKIKNASINTLILIAYKFRRFKSISLLTKKISIEYLDQIIECGMIDGFRMLGDALFIHYDMPQIQGASSRVLDDNLILNYYQMIHGVIKETYADEAIDKVIIDVRKDIDKKNCDIKIIRSKNKVLSEQHDISKTSIDRILDVLVPDYKDDNIYTSYLEDYVSKDGLCYKIPIDESFSVSGFIPISKNKVLRLLNEHTLEGHDITHDLVKSCMLYNLIVTDEILEELDNNITKILMGVHLKQKKIEKSIK